MSVSRKPTLVPEWAPQSSIFIAWPNLEGDFAPWLQAVEATYVSIAKAVLDHEALWVAVRNPEQRQRVESRLKHEGAQVNRLSFIEMPFDDVWVRDTAPLSLESSGQISLVDFRFNGWGGKYPAEEDAQIARRLHVGSALSNLPMLSQDFVLEGGSIETDGHGTLMTTSRCLLNPNRNPQYSKAEIEQILMDQLGVERILWLDHGYADGDDTDAHVDTLARFCSSRVIAYTASERPEDEMHKDFKAMERQLRDFVDRDGRPYELVPLPMPAPIQGEEGQRLPATYANFLIINGAVLIPVYGDPMDACILKRMAEVFPDRRLIPIDCVPLIRQYGSLHCMTMQFPLIT